MWQSYRQARSASARSAHHTVRTKRVARAGPQAAPCPQQVASVFGFRLTKKGFGKAIPAIGGALNWTTLESIIDTADVAYRRRLLIEKYPQLAEDESSVWLSDVEGDVAEDVDERISVIDELADAGGPDLRESTGI
ncbi:MAG: hypothetical protein QM713_03390 [Arachnia sp.]